MLLVCNQLTIFNRWIHSWIERRYCECPKASGGPSDWSETLIRYASPRSLIEKNQHESNLVNRNEYLLNWERGLASMKPSNWTNTTKNGRKSWADFNQRWAYHPEKGKSTKAHIFDVIVICLAAEEIPVKRLDKAKNTVYGLSLWSSPLIGISVTSCMILI